MKHISLPNTTLSLSAICLGTIPLDLRSFGGGMDDVVKAYLDAGGNFFDTGHCYNFWQDGGSGVCERAITLFFKRNGGRDKVVIATKGGCKGWKGYRKVDRHISAERVAADLDDSLARLDCDTIDLYWLHNDDPRETVEYVIDYMNEEVRKGRIRFFGASNWHVSRIEAANAYAAASGKQGFVASSQEWNLARPEIPMSAEHFLPEEGVAWHRRMRFPQVPYTATAKGFFAGAREGEERYNNDVSRERRERVRELAAQLGCTPTQVALAWLMHQEFPVIPIFSSGNKEHVEEAMGAAEIALTAEQVGWLEGGRE